MIIERAERIGFCFGVKRAINILETAAREHDSVATLGAVVHNQQVLDRLAKLGIKVARNIDEVGSDTVAISAHGVRPEVAHELSSRQLNLIDTTCPFVHRVQIAARKLAKAGFFVIVYGDADHPEVEGVLGHAQGRGVATLDEQFITKLDRLPRHLGVLSQTTQIPLHFTEFVKKLIDLAFSRDSALRIIDTICHDTRDRQEAALNLARRVELMLVIGDQTSANTNRLAQLCAAATRTYLVGTVHEIQLAWLRDRYHIGITAGASTPEETINEVVTGLQAMT